MTNLHSVTVTTKLEDEGTPDGRRYVDAVKFTCTGADDADCRTYPKCDCEVFNWNDEKTHDVEGHERVTGRACWLSEWFTAEGAVYTGADYDDMRNDCIPAVDRSGLIKHSFLEEWIEWEFIAPALSPSEYAEVQRFGLDREEA